MCLQRWRPLSGDALIRTQLKDHQPHSCSNRATCSKMVISQKQGTIVKSIWLRVSKEREHETYFRNIFAALSQIFSPALSRWKTSIECSERSMRATVDRSLERSFKKDYQSSIAFAQDSVETIWTRYSMPSTTTKMVRYLIRNSRPEAPTSCLAMRISGKPSLLLTRIMTEESTAQSSKLPFKTEAVSKTL